MLLTNHMNKSVCSVPQFGSSSMWRGRGRRWLRAAVRWWRTTPSPPKIITKNFTVSVSEIDVSQTSTGESVMVDTSGVTANGTVEVSQ